ncbi:hypothetical protein UO82_07830, partial [Enterobacter hormaechei]
YIYDFLMFNLAKGLSYKQKLNGSFFLIIDKSHPDGCEGGCFLCYCVRIVLSAIKMGLFFYLRIFRGNKT